MALTLLVLLVAYLIPAPSLSLAQSATSIKDNGVTLDFPNGITFKAHVDAPGKLDRVVLEYGVDKLTCGTVVAKALPDFTLGATSADISWTWDMRKSGSEPPGSHIWYRWHVTDKAGLSTLSEKKSIPWLDSTHKWNSLSRDKITFHWYSGSRQFAQDLLDSASASLARLGETTGVSLTAPVDMYIYANTDDMKAAILYEPNWTGGEAFPDASIVIIGISSDQADWGKTTEAHELTHLLVGHLTFSCLGSIPTWLNEGIAVYGQGGPAAEAMAQLQSAITKDTLMSVRALSGGFSESSDKANLSYSESYSLVNYLVTAFGRDKMLKLFGNLRDGLKIEDALQNTYSFGLDGLEDGWRASIGAKARSGAGSAPSPTVPPTPVPTYRPSSDAPVAPLVNTTALPQSSATTQPGPTPSVSAASSPSTTTSGDSNRLLMGIILAVVGVLLFGGITFYVRTRMRSATIA